MTAANARYDRIGTTYDTTRRADPYLAGRLFELLQPAPNGRYVDIGCGSGNYTLALAQRGVDLTGVDQSVTMLAKARQKGIDQVATDESANVKWCQANVSQLPFDDGAFDGGLCTLATHHFDDLHVAFREIRRVLRGGRLVMLTASREQMQGYWLNAYWPDAMKKSIAQMPDLKVVEATLRDVGFSAIRKESYSIAADLQDFFLYSGKHRPELYLDAAVRAGISTFSIFGVPEEVADGLARLNDDIATGRINDVITSFEHDGGDYLFVVAEV